MLRPLTRATLLFATALLLGLRAAPFDISGFLPLALGGVCVLLAPALLQRSGRVAVSQSSTTTRHPRRSAVPAFLLVTGAGYLLGAVTAAETRDHCLVHLPDGASLRAHGHLAALPDPDGAVVLSVRQMALSGKEAACEGAVRAYGTVERWAGAVGGSEVAVWGRWLVTPPRGAWPRRPEWSGYIVVDSVRIEGAPSLVRHPGAVLRGRAQHTVRTLFARHAGLVEGLLLAQRGGIDPAVRERFTQSGLAHLLAISGLHVGIMAGVLLLAGRIVRASARASSLAAVGGTIAYVIFLGAPHAASRAALQLGLMISARLLQRPSDRFSPLAAAGLVLLAVDPLAILDAGFQLSFAGTAGVIALRSRLMEALPFGRIRFLQDSLATSIAATAATAPLTALHFNSIAPVGIASNLAAIPLIGAAVPAVAVALGVGTIWPAAGAFLAAGAELILDAVDRIAALAASVPGGSLLVPRDAVLAWALAAFATAVMAGWLGRVASDASGGRRTPEMTGAPVNGRKGGGTRPGAVQGVRLDPSPGMRPFVRRITAASVGLALVVAWPAVAWHSDSGVLEIHAIDVGQGDALAIRSPAGRWVLVDAGPRTQTFDAGRARVVPFLLRHGVRRLEAMILTHPDADHIGGAPSVLDAIEVGAIVDPGLAAGKSLFLNLLSDVERRDVPWIAARADHSVEIDGMVLRFLYPDESSLDEDVTSNQVSVAFRLEYGNFGALFLGDLPAEVERRLAAERPAQLQAELLKVAHHGSATSTSDELLAATEPKYAVISVGRHNRYRHPNPAVLDRLERQGVQVLRTDRDGAIRVRVGQDGRLAISTAR